jgi:hypothetical protein
MCRSGSEFTYVGGFLACITAILSLGLGFALPYWLLPMVLPPGTYYPVLVIGIVCILFGALFFAGTAWLLEQLGIQVTRPSKTNSSNTKSSG